MRAATFIGLLLFTMSGCPSDDGGGNETGTNTDGTSTGTPSTSSPSTTASTSSPSTTDEPTSSSSESGSSGEPTTTGDTDTDTASSSSTGGGEFIVTSPQFEQDGLIPSEHHAGGDNTMPQLDWTGAPADAMSFGVFFRDLDFMMGFEHSAIWNISADATGTPFDPEHVAMPPDPAGSVQCRNWMGDFGYGGPGSGSPGVPGNTYEFEVYALDVADLSAEIDENSSLEEVEAALEAHAIESTSISGQTAGPPEK